MEAFADAFRQAEDKLKVADYGLGKVFSMTKDPSVIRSAIINLHDAQVRSLDALLLFERTYKRVPAYPVGHLETKLRLFSEHCVKRYGLSEDMVAAIREGQEWASVAKVHPPQVSPDNRVIFRLEGFQVMTLSLASIKEKLAKTSIFAQKIKEVLTHA